MERASGIHFLVKEEVNITTPQEPEDIKRSFLVKEEVDLGITISIGGEEAEDIKSGLRIKEELDLDITIPVAENFKDNQCPYSCGGNSYIRRHMRTHTDWLKLRKNLHIVGNLVGCLAHLPRQNVFNGLPMTLLPEEVSLILEKGVGLLLALQDPCAVPSSEAKRKYEEYVEKVNREQVQYYEEVRKKQVTSMIDRIIEGKKRKLMGMQTKKKFQTSDGSQEESSIKNIELDREAILKSELEKVEETPPSAILVQTFTVDPWLNEDDFTPVEWTYPNTPLEKIKYKVYKDLWEQNYFITSGTKFGGDFLVYPGEPVKFHAHFIVLCMEHDSKIPMSDMIMHARIGNATRKTFVVAALDETEKVIYQSVQWAEIA